MRVRITTGSPTDSGVFPDPRSTRMWLNDLEVSDSVSEWTLSQPGGGLITLTVTLGVSYLDIDADAIPNIEAILLRQIPAGEKAERRRFPLQDGGALTLVDGLE